jgi:hypothetical protein
MTIQALEAPRFIRKTQLASGEYHKNFHKIDGDIIRTVTSSEADKVTPLMSKIYLRLTTAPTEYWERDGVLRFEAEWREGKHVKAWSVLCEILGVASATASKALTWMHDVGVIGYFSGKNGVGIRIFLNRAATSIGKKQNQGGEKILQFAPASSLKSPASRNEPAFNDSFAVLDEVSDSDLFAAAHKACAPDKQTVVKKDSEPNPVTASKPQALSERDEDQRLSQTVTQTLSVDEIVRRLRRELEPTVESAAQRAAQREHERTREWLESRGLPKAARVAQREAYNMLRQNGVIGARNDKARAGLELGRSDYTPAEAKPLSAEDVQTFAQVCMAMMETQGQSIDVTLAEMSSEVGGPVLPDDAPKVREAAQKIIESSRKE